MRIPPRPAIADQLPRSKGSAADLANPLSQPALPKGDTFDGVNFGKLKYRFFKGQASTGKYEYTDVIQGEIGDCFFLSSSVAINAVDAEFLGGHFESKPDGTHIITLFHWLGEREPIKVAVDNQFPVHEGKIVFGRGRGNPGKDGREDFDLRPALHEKAYAKLKGSYRIINEGGIGGEGLVAQTGVDATTHEMKRLSDDDLWRQISKFKEQRTPVITSSPEQEDLKQRIHELTGQAFKDLENLDGLIDGHVYGLVRVFAKPDGTRMVRLGTALRPKDATYTSTKRTVDLPLSAWRKYFDNVTISTPLPPRGARRLHDFKTVPRSRPR
jgi:hypothetical protein